MRALLEFLILPREMSAFERGYLARVNRIALLFFAMHLPAFMLIAHFNGTGAGVAALLTCGALLGPAVAYLTLKNPRAVSVVMGVAAMFFGGVLVHLGQGPVQIEMHFYFFALIAMCAVFGNPLVIIAAAVTVALHHLVVWLTLPSSVFNYEAAWWVVGVHAAFVVLESVATCFIARSFFDNVIGLEKIVQARTAALDAKNRDMRMLLDNVSQGFLTIDAEGRLAPERSAAIDQWFGAPEAGSTWFAYLERLSPAFAARTRLGWTEVVEGVMPLELTLDQLPHRLELAGKHFRFDYRPIGASEPFDHYLVVVTDVTTEVEREALDLERREGLAVFERFLVDRSGFECFFDEAGAIVEGLVKGGITDAAIVKRLIHTLKGNAALYGLPSLVNVCHRLEDGIAEEGKAPRPEQYEELAARWKRLANDVERWFLQRPRVIEVDDAEYAALVRAIESGELGSNLLARVRALRLEPAAKRLGHFAEQAQRIAGRLEKGHVNVALEDNGVRLEASAWNPFWSVLIHAVRNAVDHGLEVPEARRLAGKPAEGSLVLRTKDAKDEVVVEVEDDGCGIDWDAIRERAVARGLPCRTNEDLREALFVDGLTTATQVTDLSGRGVGMGALLHGTRALGGALTVTSVRGEGTKMRMTFPKRSIPRDSMPSQPTLQGSPS